MPAQNDVNLKLMASIEKMPSLPTTVTKVIELANDINSSPRDLLKVIQLDPVLTAKVLKLINSAFFGMPNKVSLKQAVVMLGINTIKNLALSTAIIGQMGQSKIKVKNFDQHLFWQHSLCAAIAAKKICRKIEPDPRLADEYFVAGLVHDIGKIVMALALPQWFAATIDHARANELSSVRAETDKMGIDHAEVGSLLAQKWSLSENLVDATHYHHVPEENHHRLVWVVHLANCWVEKLGYISSKDFVESWLDEKAYEILKITEEEINAALKNLPEEIEKATIFLSS
ncbi:MAG: HDOD domain-containing protein [Candidatus Glassbacteria bacterium]|nr:HDOD domain-containing protein [Candidatus Glassbacteria bacterium]